MNYVDHVLPVDLQDYVFWKVHQEPYGNVLNQLTLFDKDLLLDTTRSSYNTFKFVELLLQVNEMEDKLYNAINQDSYTSILVNTNIPEVILRKTCGLTYEIKIRTMILARCKFPYALRKYLLYNKLHDAKKFNNYYYLKARSNKELIDLKPFPGGLESWSYYNHQNMAELKDLSKHQWNYLDYDIQITNLKKFSTAKEKLIYIKTLRKEFRLF